MNKVNNYSMIVLAAFLVIAIIANTINLVINIILSNKIKAYENYYNASESLFEEIEDYNENLFDTDKAVDYYTAKSKLNNNK